MLESVLGWACARLELDRRAAELVQEVRAMRSQQRLAAWAGLLACAPLVACRPEQMRLYMFRYKRAFSTVHVKCAAECARQERRYSPQLCARQVR